METKHKKINALLQNKLRNEIGKYFTLKGTKTLKYLGMNLTIHKNQVKKARAIIKDNHSLG